MRIHPLTAASCAAVLLFVAGWVVGIHQRFGPSGYDVAPAAMGEGWQP